MIYKMEAYDKQPVSFNDYCFIAKDKVKIGVEADNETDAFSKAFKAIDRELFRIIEISESRINEK